MCGERKKIECVAVELKTSTYELPFTSPVGILVLYELHLSLVCPRHRSRCTAATTTTQHPTLFPFATMFLSSIARPARSALSRPCHVALRGMAGTAQSETSAVSTVVTQDTCVCCG